MTTNKLPPYIAAQRALKDHLEKLTTPELILENLETTKRLSAAVQREFEALPR